MCESKEGQSISRASGCGCGCCGCGCGTFSRRFLTEKEKKERLEEYKAQLKRELEGVEEHIQEFKCQ